MAFSRIWGLLICFLALTLTYCGEARAESFSEHRHFIKLRLAKDGVPPAVINRAFAGVKPDKRVEKANKNQPELRSTVADYVQKRVSTRRVELGQQALKPTAPFINSLSKKYHVDGYVIAAIWGLESSYGSILSNKTLIKPVINSMVNLSYRSASKREFAYKQIRTLFKFEAEGNKRAELYQGSWAGAVGHTQFIPTTQHAYAVDGDGDARIDLEGSVYDALASTGNYLHVHGWNPRISWGAPVRLPKNFDYRLASERAYHSPHFWQKRGVRLLSKVAVSALGEETILYLPSGSQGPAFLLTPNFKVIRRYNHSDSYALSVGLLADRLKGMKYQLNWGKAEEGLTLTEAKHLQLMLRKLGHYQGKIDGLIGKGTKSALAAYQHSVGLTPDGHANRKTLATMGTTATIRK